MEKKTISKKKTTRKKRIKKPFEFETEFEKFIYSLIVGTDSEKSFKEEFFEQLQFLTNLGLGDYFQLYKQKYHHVSYNHIYNDKRITFYLVYFKDSEYFKLLLKGLNDSIKWFDDLNEERKNRWENETFKKASGIEEAIEVKYKDVYTLEEMLNQGRQIPKYLKYIYKTLKRNESKIYEKLLEDERNADIEKIKQLIKKHNLSNMFIFKGDVVN